ncbi:MAG: hypothetical protein IJ960_03880 [Oscillospiraceae bacterium]|nr:hypothetical protein [Oscillospiraceae bacterium]
MKRSHIALVLALLMCLTLFGCGKDAPETTAPTTTPTVPETTAPQTVTPIITEPVETQPPETEKPGPTIESFTDLLNSDRPEAYWLCQAIGCVFGQPEDIDPYYFFYNGIVQNCWDAISEESVAWLESQGHKKGSALQVMPLDDMEQVMQDVFGISMADVEAGIPDRWRYLQEEKAYASFHSDVRGGMGGITITWVDEYAGGRIDVFYSVSGSYYNTATGEWLDNPDMVLALRQQPDGSYQILANIEAPEK